MSQGLRGRSVPSTPHQPTPPLTRISPTAATPSKTFLTLSKTLLTLLQKGLTSRGSSLGGQSVPRSWGRSSPPVSARLVILQVLRVKPFSEPAAGLRYRSSRDPPESAS